MKEYAFGVDIGGTTIKIGLFRTDGELLEAWEIPTRKENNGEFILSDISNAVKGKMSEKNIPVQNMEGIGMGVPGPIKEDGTVLKCVNLGWGVFNIEEKMHDITGFKIKAGNDANVAALGEMWQGGGKGYKNLVMVTLGTGVGAGIIINERILPGNDGAAGEIGHMPMSDEETRVCGCGKKGCLEQYTSGTGVVFMAGQYLDEHPEVESLLRNRKDFTAKDVFDAAREGDHAALDTVEYFGKMLGKGLAATACVVNPEVFVLGGGVAKAGKILMDVVEKYYRQYAFHASRDTAFREAKLSNQAGMYGGVRLLLE